MNCSENHLPSDSHTNYVFFLMPVGYFQLFRFCCIGMNQLTDISKWCMCRGLCESLYATELIEEAIEEKYRLELGIILLNGLGHALVTLGCSSYNNRQEGIKWYQAIVRNKSMLRFPRQNIMQSLDSNNNNNNIVLTEHWPKIICYADYLKLI